MEKRYLYLGLIIVAVIMYYNLFIGEQFEYTENVSIIAKEKYNQSTAKLVSFDKFSDIDKLHGRLVNFLGFLEYRLVDSTYIRFLVDDFDNQIEVKDVKETDLYLFEKGEITGPFNITGIFIKDYDRLVADLMEINVGERKEVLNERVLSKEKNITNTSEHNLGGFFVREFGCSDGTPLGECSETKPLYCSGSILVENGEECG